MRLKFNFTNKRESTTAAKKEGVVEASLSRSR